MLQRSTTILVLSSAVVASQSWVEARAGPRCLQVTAPKHHALVQPKRAVVPELDLERAHAKDRPVRGPRHFAEPMSGRLDRYRLFQRKAALERARLLRGPGAELGPSRTRCE